ncbi:MAG: hypothetical protein PHS82_05500 [Lachnospiraceae bacterium]|nr:hypothetical protein [Lachnospiraceae bacterium]
MRKKKKSEKQIYPIAHQNKDIASKTFTEMFPREAMEVYGVHLPAIVRIIPTNLPAVLANELRIDNIFELADGSFAILDYESSYKETNKIKYLEYIVRILRRYKKRGIMKLRMIVLYTADVTEEETNATLDIGALQVSIEQAFLSKLDSEEIRQRLTAKIKGKEKLTNKELMEFVILPLTYRGKEKKKEVIEELFSVAKDIDNEKTQIFVLSGIMVFADKVIDKGIACQMKEWIMMTKVAKLFEEEKQQALREQKKKVTKEVTKEVARGNALAMLKEGDPVEKVVRCVKELSAEEIQALAESL